MYSPIYLVYVSAKTSDNPNPIQQSSKFKPPKKKKEKEKDTEPDTELSKYIWDLKDKNITSYSKWFIVKQTSGYNSITSSCNLRLSEKLAICDFRDKGHLINKRMDLVSKC